jgi:hypothetical protein
VNGYFCKYYFWSIYSYTYPASPSAGNVVVSDYAMEQLEQIILLLEEMVLISMVEQMIDTISRRTLQFNFCLCQMQHKVGKQIQLEIY